MHLFLRDFQGQLDRTLNCHWGRTGTEIPDDDQLTDQRPLSRDRNARVWLGG